MSEKLIYLVRHAQPDAPAGEQLCLGQSLNLPLSAHGLSQARTLGRFFASLGVPRIYISSGDGKIYSTYSDNPVATYGQLAADIEACLGRLNQEARDPS